MNLFFLLIVVFIAGFISCKEGPGTQPKKSVTIEDTSGREDVKAVIEKFLVVSGNYDTAKMAAMISDKANIGISRYSDSGWNNTVITIGEYFDV